MNIIILLAFVVSVFSIVAAESERKPSHCASKNCTRVLEAIVFQPETYYKEYLDRISEEIKVAGPYILWTTQAQGFIEAFEAKYDVLVTILNSFRNDLYSKNISTGNYFRTTTIANLNGSGYAYISKPGMKSSILEFIVFNPNGELKHVMITLYFELLG
jgi:hypothetical protein